MVVDATSFVVQIVPPQRTLHLFAVVGYDPPKYDRQDLFGEPAGASNRSLRPAAVHRRGHALTSALLMFANLTVNSPVEGDR